MGLISKQLGRLVCLLALPLLTGCDLFGSAKIKPTIKYGPSSSALSRPEDIQKTSDLIPQDNAYVNKINQLSILVSGTCITDAVAVLITTSGQEISLTLDCSTADGSFSTRLDLSGFADGQVQIQFDYLRSRNRTTPIYSLTRTVIKDTEGPPAFTVPGTLSESSSGTISLSEVPGAVTYLTTFNPAGGGDPVGPLESTLPAVSVRGLSIGETYSVAVTVRDAAGNETVASNTGTFSKIAPPDPVSPSATAVSGAVINLGWTSAGGSTADFRIAYQTGAVAPASCNVGTVISETAINGNSHSVDGLAGETQYSFRICAINSDTTPGASAGVIVSATTLQSAPPNPTAPNSTAASTTQINLGWTSGGGSTTDYRISYQSGAAAPATCAAGTMISESAISGTSHSVTGLSAGTQYSFRICAINGNPTPDVSSGVTISGSTLQLAPPNPTSPSATGVFADQINLSWTSGGGSTTDYRVSYQPGATAPATCADGTTISESAISGTSHSVTGLSASTQYSFRICAINDNPTPDVSSGVTVSGSTLQSAPPNPTSPNVPTTSGTVVEVSWTSGGGSTDGFRISYQAGASAPANCASGTTIPESAISGTSHSVTGLRPGRQYSFRICAINGNSPPDVSSGVTVSGSTTPDGFPPNPTGQTATAASSSRIDLAWTSGGGSTFDYRISYQSGATAPADCASGTTISESSISGVAHAVTGLSASTQYAFRICAINDNPTPDVSSGVTATATTSAGGGGGEIHHLAYLDLNPPSGIIGYLQGDPTSGSAWTIDGFADSPSSNYALKGGSLTLDETDDVWIGLGSRENAVGTGVEYKLTFLDVDTTPLTFENNPTPALGSTATDNGSDGFRAESVTVNLPVDGGTPRQIVSIGLDFAASAPPDSFVMARTWSLSGSPSYGPQTISSPREAQGSNSPPPRALSAFSDSSRRVHAFWLYPNTNNKLMIAYDIFDSVLNSWSGHQSAPTKAGNGTDNCDSMRYLSAATDYGTGDDRPYVVYLCNVVSPSAYSQIVYASNPTFSWNYQSVVTLAPGGPATNFDTRFGFTVWGNVAHLVYWNATGDLAYRKRTTSWSSETVIESNIAGVSHTPEVAISQSGKVTVYYVLDKALGHPDIKVWRETDPGVYSKHVVKEMTGYAAEQVFLGRGVGVKGKPGNSRR